MVNEIYNTAVDLKENLEGYEELQDVIYYPSENVRTRIKNTKVYTQDTVSALGIHLDREDVSGVLDNPLLKLDATPDFDKVLHSITCPNGELIELFNIPEDVVSTSSAVYSPNMFTIGVNVWGISVPFTVPATLGTQSALGVSEIFEFRPGKMIKNIKIIVNDGNEDNLTKAVDYGQGFVTMTGNLFVADNASATPYDNKLRWKITNDGVSPLIVTKVVVIFDYF